MLGRLVNIDNILIYSPSPNLHVTHIKKVLSHLWKYQLYVKDEKCEFYIDQITCLGYVISTEGVTMDKQNMSTVTAWPHPSTVKELQQFLGFVNFYWWFIQVFSSMAAPLTTMLKEAPKRLT